MKDSFVWNPFRKWPVNLQCWCGSGVKHKKCCLFKVHDFIPSHMGKQVNDLYKQAMMIYGKKD